MSATPNDTMKDIERLARQFGLACYVAGQRQYSFPRMTGLAEYAALLAAIGKLVSSTQPAMSQDAQPVAPLAMEALEDAMRWLAAFAYGHGQMGELAEVQASPRWGKYTQAIALLRSQVQGGLSTNNEEMK